MTRPRTPILALIVAATLALPVAAHPGQHDHPDTTSVEPVRSAEESRRILERERGHLEYPAISIGAEAPELSIAEWVKGESIRRLAEDRIYVVEFWATWCTPCVRAFPHITELQEEYDDQVTVIGVNIWDRGRDRQTGDFTEPMPEFVERVESFVADQGDKMGYTVAIEESGEMAETWMRAAGRRGIPSAFIVDGEGEIAWMGHPMDMDEPLEEIVEGSWDKRDAAEAYKKSIEPELWYAHFMGLLSNEETAERGYRLGYALLRTPFANDPSALNAIAWNTLTSEAIPIRDPRFAIALASVACEKTDWRDAANIDTLARGYFDAGEHEKAVEYQQRAVELAEGSPSEEQLRETLERYRRAAEE